MVPGEIPLVRFTDATHHTTGLCALGIGQGSGMVFEGKAGERGERVRRRPPVRRHGELD